MDYLIRTDCSDDIGGGHAMRTLALAQEIRRRGGSVGYAMVDCLDFFPQRLDSENIPLHQLQGPPGSDNDREGLEQVLETVDPDWLLLDGYGFGENYQRTIRQQVNLLVVDDHAQIGSYDCDLLLDQNIDTTKTTYEGLSVEGTKVLVGSEYVLLREEFLSLDRKKPDNNGRKTVLITLGTGAHDQLLRRLLRSFEHYSSTAPAIDVVLLSDVTDYVQSLELPQTVTITCRGQTHNMAALMADSDLAISGGGSTCWELGYMGVPNVIFVLSDNQRPIAEALDDRGVSINLGDPEKSNIESVPGLLEDLLTDSDRHSAMARRGKKLIDGRGAKRVLDAMESLAP